MSDPVLRPFPGMDVGWITDSAPDPATDEPEADAPAFAPAFRTLADIDDSPPGPLLLGMLEPDAPNLLYALGGTGKGSTAAWMIRELLALGHRPLIYDAENRPREWARRTSGLGVNRAEVAYVQPSDLPRNLLGRPLWDVTPHLGALLRAARANVLCIDSVLPATGLGEERLRSDPQVPYLYVAALDALGVTSVSLGHPPKGQPAGEPFGSVGWVNAMRLTWNGIAAEAPGHVVRWTPRKRNERGHIPSFLLTFEYSEDGRLANVTRADDEESTREWLIAALTGATSRSVGDLAEEHLDQRDETPTAEHVQRTKDRLRQVLRRMEREGLAIKTGSGPKTVWALRWAG